MLKDLLIGSAVGFVVGAFMVKNCKPCADAVDSVTQAAEKKLKEMEKNKQSESHCDCEN